MNEIKNKAITIIKNQKVLLATIAIFILSSFMSPTFLTLENLRNLLLQISIYGIISVGVMMVMLTGEFDISVGSVMALGGVLAALITNAVGYTLALLVMIPLALVIGYIYGFMVDTVKINSFVATLGGMFFYRGISYILCEAQPVSCLDDAFMWMGTKKLFGTSYIVYVFLLSVVIAWFVISKTRFGRNVCATGGNYNVAKSSGIKVSFYKYAVYIICAFASLLAGVLAASRLGRAMPNAGDDASMSAISAVVIGGTSMSGGEGGALQTLLGVFLLGMITNILNTLGIMAYYQLAIKGLILIVIVCVDRFYRNREVG